MVAIAKAVQQGENTTLTYYHHVLKLSIQQIWSNIDSFVGPNDKCMSNFHSPFSSVFGLAKWLAQLQNRSCLYG